MREKKRGVWQKKKGTKTEKEGKRGTDWQEGMIAECLVVG